MCIGGARRPRSLVAAENDLGDAAWLVDTLTFEGEFHGALDAARYVGDFHQPHAKAKVRADLDRRHETNLVCSIVDPHGESGDLNYLRVEHRPH